MLNIQRLRLGLNASGAGLPFAPSAFADLLVWHKQSSISSGASWIDSSGNGNNLTGIGGAASPTATNGRLVFTAANNTAMTWGSGVDVVPGVTYVVGKYTGSTTGQILSNTATNVQFRYESSGTAAGVNGSPENLGTAARTAVDTTVWRRLRLITTASSNPGVANDGEATFAIDDNSGIAQNHDAGAFVFNQVGRRTTGNESLDAELAEILVFNRPLTVDEMSSVEAYLDRIIVKMNALDA
jgi:hypothetical protein